MKMIIVVALALVAAAVAAPPASEPIKILSATFEQQPDGPYKFGFETENGISRSEDGDLKQALDDENKPHDVIVVRGKYSFPGENGELETISYTADETGYHAEGKSIPKSVSRR